MVHNVYLVGRMFWSDDAARSEVCWGTTQPNFDYAQVRCFKCSVLWNRTEGVQNQIGTILILNAVQFIPFLM